MNYWKNLSQQQKKNNEIKHIVCNLRAPTLLLANVLELKENGKLRESSSAI